MKTFISLIENDRVQLRYFKEKKKKTHSINVIWMWLGGLQVFRELITSTKWLVWLMATVL